MSKKLDIIISNTDIPSPLENFPFRISLDKNKGDRILEELRPLTTISDNFIGNNYDLPDKNLWDLYAAKFDVTSYIYDNRLRMIGRDGVSGWAAAYYLLKYKVRGDFDIEVSFYDYSGDIEAFGALRIYTDNGNENFIGPYTTNGWWSRLAGSDTKPTNRSYNYGKLKITRSANQMSTYIKDGDASNWVNIQNSTVDTSDIDIELYLIRNNAHGFQIDFYDFKINKGRLVISDDINCEKIALELVQCESTLKNYAGQQAFIEIDYWQYTYDKNVLLMIRSLNEQGHNFIDDSINNRPITVYGQVVHSDNQYIENTSIYFDGNTDILTIANSNDFSFTNNEYTIELYLFPVNILGGHTAAHLLNKRHEIWNNNENSFSLIWYDTGSISFQHFIDNAGTIVSVYSVDGDVPKNTWSHIAVSYDGNDLRLFINGILRSTVSLSTSMNIGTHPISIGAIYPYNSDNWAIEGYMDNITIYNQCVYTSSFIPGQNLPDGRAELWAKIPYLSDTIDTKLKLYANKNNSPNITFVGKATTSPATTLSVNYNENGVYDTSHSAYGDVLFDTRLDKYVLFYSGFDNSHWRIMLAISDDGLRWQKNTMVVPYNKEGTYDTVHAATPTVVYHNNIYEMWYQVSDNSNWRICHAISDDGIDWRDHKMIINYGNLPGFDDDYVVQPYVLLIGNVYNMWFRCTAANNYTIWHCLSNDGINWYDFSMSIQLNDMGTYDSDKISEPHVLYEDGYFEIFYTGTDSNDVNRIIHAISTDGINWSDHQMVIDIGIQGTYDSVGTTSCFAIKKQDMYRIWYTVSDGTNYRILHTYMTE